MYNIQFCCVLKYIIYRNIFCKAIRNMFLIYQEMASTFWAIFISLLAKPDVIGLDLNMPVCDPTVADTWGNIHPSDIQWKVTVLRETRWKFRRLILPPGCSWQTDTLSGCNNYEWVLQIQTYCLWNQCLNHHNTFVPVFVICRSLLTDSHAVMTCTLSSNVTIRCKG